MKRIFSLFICCLLLTGCAAQTGTVDFAPAEENRLVVYTSHTENVYRPLLREFEERTGIWVELVTGGSNELLDRLTAEQEDPHADIMFGGGVETLQAHKNLFQKAQCANSEFIAPAFQEEEAFWTPFSALPVVLIYNTKLVSPDDLTGWVDMVGGSFRGKIAFADPSKSSSSFTALVTAAYAAGQDIIQPFAEQLEGNLLNSSSDVPVLVADGTCLVGITLEETALKYISMGSDLALVYPKEGTSCIPDGTAVIRDAHHLENAIRFLEFTLSDEVQQMLGSQFYRRSVRSDIAPPDYLPSLDELHLVRYDAEWASSMRNEILARWDSMVKEAA